MQKKSLVIKILVPVLIVVVIGAMWLIKNKNSTDTSLTDTQNEQTNADIPEHLKEADFSLNETSEIDFEALSKYGVPIIADYGADSCIPCKQMAPVLKKLNVEMQGKAFIKFVDVWQYGEAASNVPVQVIPTQVIFNADGSPFMPSEALAKEIQFDMYSHRDAGEHIFTVHQGGLTEEQMRKILKEMGVE
ncbi:MAG: thioredoxin family protein [Ruminococcaceae bacterium]|nr:thioredoxin family protein [Oscillospiraceae bacterium]